MAEELPSASPLLDRPPAAFAAPRGAARDAAVLDAGLDPAAGAPPSPARAFWAAFRENRGAVMGLAVVVAIVLVALLANVIAPHSPLEQFRDAVKAPPVWEEGGSWRFVLGTDV